MSEAVIVGGGPAGLACALALRQIDLEVRVIERRPLEDGALDKVCGEGLMPDAVANLERLGVPTATIGGRPFLGIRYLDESLTAEGRFALGHGLGVRRTALHRALVERAQAQGVKLEFGRPVDGLQLDSERDCYRLQSAGDTLAASVVVGADGLRSGLRRAAGLERPARESAPRFGIRRHFEVEPWSELVEVYWAVGAEAYVTPLGDRLVGVAILWRPRRPPGGRPGGPPAGGGPPPRESASARFERLLAQFPELAGRLPRSAALTPARGLGPLRQPAVTRARRNLFLVGDAGGYRDAITGEGMALAFSQAHLLAAALVGGPRSEAAPRYAAAARSDERLPGALTELVLALARHPGLRHRALRALSRRPSYFDRLLAVHTRELSVRRLGIGSTLRFGAELLRWGA